MIFINLLESRVAYIQYKLYSNFKLGNFKVVKNFQKLLTNSLVLRLRVVRNVVDSQSFNLLDRNYFIFSNQDKLNLALNLNYSMDFFEFNNILVSKKKSLSFFFEFPSLYSLCVKSLFVDVISPVLDSFPDRVFKNFIPYRPCQDFFFNCKTAICKLNRPFWLFTCKLSFGFYSRSWLIKNLLFDKNFLKKFLKSSDFNIYVSEKNIINNNLFLILFNFLLNGLFRYWKSIIYTN